MGHPDAAREARHRVMTVFVFAREASSPARGRGSILLRIVHVRACQGRNGVNRGAFPFLGPMEEHRNHGRNVP